ncbi:unnamed protein product [Paramecium octaurelia]|uniref:PHD-type domain-containing protein n=1 Tax=Paramecium octaurelia TaxID=43137 RepID=A0A8S1XU64_PAROT|nr:unnamed protein product [Paramecium octaurelia]
MTTFEEPIIQIIVDEIAEEQGDHKNRKHFDDKKKNKQQLKAEKSQKGVRSNFDGKQQFGDKTICRLCQKTTLEQVYNICNRCHFRYHQECANQHQYGSYNEETQKWICKKCINRIEILTLKNKDKKKKKRKVEIQVQSTTEQSDNENNGSLSEFLLRFPTYKNQGQILFPILDEYLVAYSDLFHVEVKKKPIIKEDSDIPNQYFYQVLIIWDSYNNYDKIVSDILNIEEGNSDNQSQIGTFIHFKDQHQFYSQKSRKQIYQMLHTEPLKLIEFFSWFYTKQLIEDVDFEQIQKTQENAFWYLMGFLWYNNREQYYEIYKESLQYIAHYLYQQGILCLNDDDLKLLDQNNKDYYLNLILILIEGLPDLKKTPNLISHRIENLISNNKIKEQLAAQVKDLRAQTVDMQLNLDELEKEIQALKIKLSQEELSKTDFVNTQSQIENINLQMIEKEQEKSKITKKLISVQERYIQLEEELQLVQIPNLLINPSMFLGFDLKNSLYYFFLNERDKVFIQQRNSWIDSNMKWGFYNFDDVEILLKSLNLKGIKEWQLKLNLEEIKKQKLILSEPNPSKLTQNGNEKEVEEREFKHKQNGKPQDKQQTETQVIQLCKMLNEIDSNLTNYLNEKNCRWCSASVRSVFRKSYDENKDSIDCLKKAVEFFIENTQTQERLDKLKEGDTLEDNLYIDFDEDSAFLLTRKKKIVEDEDVENENFKQLEALDASKLKIRRMPMKLFGSYFENLRQCLLDQVRDKYCDLLQLKTCLVVLKEVIKMYIQRKQEECQRQEKKKNTIQQQQLQPSLIIEEIYRDQVNKVQIQDGENIWEEQCKVCGQGGKVILCDTCPRVFHPKCLKLKEIPKGKWSCMICLSYFSRQVKTRQTFKKMQTK